MALPFQGEGSKETAPILGHLVRFSILPSCSGYAGRTIRAALLTIFFCIVLCVDNPPLSVLNIVSTIRGLSSPTQTYPLDGH